MFTITITINIIGDLFAQSIILVVQYVCSHFFYSCLPIPGTLMNMPIMPIHRCVKFTFNFNKVKLQRMNTFLDSKMFIWLVEK